ncbi:eEF1A lysine and N-terminal methyltransferase (eEF1A-KNMT) (Methyltransferase-like protein 13) [Includes: eEF1A lysine methyltransferase [Durusdinium trenchii]|uniref:EEF1A lysine and N-terminal methyltransferase (EEF1A-KNMT) (Methyltransferase-like protein 13) n=1 Tax=Durusdinium trenchii TaxID=1381693 RepID=A0ABP0R038_9DINO
MAQYGKAEYWEERYTRDPEPFDWYQRWAGLKDTFTEFAQPSHAILMLGCGNSRLSEEMYEEGYHSITNIDLCMTVIKAMQEKYRDKPGLTYKQMDGRSMELPDANFNVVIDKVQGTDDESMTASLSADDKDSVHYIYVCVKGEVAKAIRLCLVTM